MSVAPPDTDLPFDTGQRQGRRLPPRPHRVPRARDGARVWTVTVASARRHVPTTLALDQDGTRPDARGPERASTVGVGDQELAIGSPEEEVGVAAREEPWRTLRTQERRGTSARRGEDPRVADRCSHRGQRPAERVERATPRREGIPAHWANASGVVGTEDVQVPARELEARVARVDLGWRHGPDRRLSRAVPPDHDRARWVRRTGAGWGVRRARSRPRRRSSSRRRGERVGERPGPPRSAARRPRRAASRARRPRGRAAATTYALMRGPQSWTSDGSSQVDGSVPSTRAWIESSAARGMLSCRPAHAARRSERRPRGSRSSSAPTCRRNARICRRVRSSRDVVTSPPDRLLCPSSEPEQTWPPPR